MYSSMRITYKLE